MTRIVTTHYRYKRPPRKRKAVAIEVPTIARKSELVINLKTAKALGLTSLLARVDEVIE